MRVAAPAGPADWHGAGRLIRAYLAELPFEIDFQDVDEELADLPAEYGPPAGGALLAWAEAGAAGPVGFVGIRRFGPAGAGEAELKRMYVAPEGRGTGAGRALAEGAVAAARDLGYRRVLLDTVAWMTAAIGIYESLGFRPIEPYRHNPLPDARYFALDL